MSSKLTSLRFPKDFLWGTATAGHQVEGNNIHSDWWAWEKKKPEIENSGITCDHYHKFRQDLWLAKNILQNNAYRFSIEWARVEPKEGKFDEKEIKHYLEVLLELKKLRMKSMVTLHHFVNPLWFARKGGWEKRQNLKYFERYVKVCLENLGDLVDFWAPINEPGMYVSQAFLFGIWPPEKKSFTSMVRVYLNMAKAHKAAYEIIHERLSNSKVLPVISMNSYVVENYPKKLLARAFNFFTNHSFLYLVKNHFDFIGINYYGPFETNFISFGKGLDTVSGINWKIYPKGIYEIVKEIWQKYKTPIMITENGNADANDSKRSEYIINHLFWLNKAIKEGVDVRGYFYWSLMDNFEWHMGRGVRFGLFEIDYKTLKRIPRKSAYMYGKIAVNNGVDDHLLVK